MPWLFSLTHQVRGISHLLHLLWPARVESVNSSDKSVQIGKSQVLCKNGYKRSFQTSDEPFHCPIHFLKAADPIAEPGQAKRCKANMRKMKTSKVAKTKRALLNETWQNRWGFGSPQRDSQPQSDIQNAKLKWTTDLEYNSKHKQASSETKTISCPAGMHWEWVQESNTCVSNEKRITCQVCRRDARLTAKKASAHTEGAPGVIPLTPAGAPGHDFKWSCTGFVPSTLVLEDLVGEGLLLSCGGPHREVIWNYYSQEVSVVISIYTFICIYIYI